MFVPSLSWQKDHFHNKMAEKVRFCLTVVGAREIEEGILSLRGRHGAQLGAGGVAEVLGALQSVAEERVLELNAEALGLVQEEEAEEAAAAEKS